MNMHNKRIQGLNGLGMNDDKIVLNVLTMGKGMKCFISAERIDNRGLAISEVKVLVFFIREK